MTPAVTEGGNSKKCMDSCTSMSSRHNIKVQQPNQAQPTVALAADLQLGALIDARLDERHDLVKLLLGHLSSSCQDTFSAFLAVNACAHHPNAVGIE